MLRPGTAFVGQALRTSEDLNTLRATAAATRLDKGGLRATLVTVWFSLNAGLTVAFLVDGTLVPALPKVAAYLPVLGTGYLLGEFLHHRLDERRFRQLVYVMLIATGAALVIR